MPIYALDEVCPQIKESAWIAANATLIGDVLIEAHASVWYGAILRGDTARLTIGEGTNIQDACVVHTDEGLPLCLGSRVTVGHGVILHGCDIGDETLMGMGAIVLNGVKVGRQCIVAAGSLLTENKQFPDGVLIMGSPARVLRELKPEEIERNKKSAQHYIDNAARYRQQLRLLA